MRRATISLESAGSTSCEEDDVEDDDDTVASDVLDVVLLLAGHKNAVGDHPKRLQWCRCCCCESTGATTKAVDSTDIRVVRPKNSSSSTSRANRGKPPIMMVSTA